jgi:hypothetical protein
MALENRDQAHVEGATAPPRSSYYLKRASLLTLSIGSNIRIVFRIHSRAFKAPSMHGIEIPSFAKTDLMATARSAGNLHPIPERAAHAHVSNLSAPRP